VGGRRPRLPQVKILKIPELKENDYRLWKPRFDDLIITTEKLLKIKMDYIHNNPVKAGLVASAVDWKYSSAVDWLTDKDGLAKIDKEYHWLVRWVEWGRRGRLPPTSKAQCLRQGS